jgi:hypothetical protein
VRQILGIECLWLRLAAQSLCLWEETGLPMAYEGSRFALKALEVDRVPEVRADTFALPQGGSSPRAPGLDSRAILAGLEAGDYTPLVLVLQPGAHVDEPGGGSG